MPIYEYECQECGRRSEEIQRFSDPPLTECSQCGGALKKLISSPAIQFKGSGWYVTDYARSSGGGGEKGGEGESSDSGNGDEKKPSSQSEAKSGSSKSSGATEKATSSNES
ncbi:MAG: FmdB family zinc ribbon protein [Acidobacteriota bacterium]